MEPVARPLGVPPVEPVVGFVEGESVEDTSLRTVSSRTWRNPDNTLTSRVHGAPVNFLDGGQWRSIDTSVIVDGSGGFRVAAAPFEARFAGSSEAETLMSFAHGGVRLEVAPPTGALPGVVPVVAGNVVTYPDLLPGVDVRYVVGRTMVKEDLILRDRLSVAPVFAFPVRMVGGSLRIASAGGYEVVDTDGTARLSLPPGFMTDADPGTWSPAGHGTVEMAVSGATGATGTLRLVPDPAWLADPARVFPVFVDPTVQIHGSSCFWHGCAGTSVDAEVFQGSPDWNGNQNWVGFLGRWIDDVGGEAGPWERVSYVHYDSTVFRYSDIYSGAWQGYWAWKECPQNSEYWMYAIGGAWNNGTGAPDASMPPITWNRRAWFGDAWHHGTGGGYIHVATGLHWNRWDITGWVANWANGAWPNRGITLDTQGSGNCRFRRLAAHENGDGSDSYIEVNHHDPTPDTPTLVAGTGTFSSSPTLTASYRDRNGEPGLVQITVETAAGAFVASSGSMQSNCGSCNLSWSPNLGEGSYRWRAYAYDDTTASPWSAYGTLVIDPSAPPAPTLSSSTHPDQQVWSTNNDPAFSWSASDLSGVTGYSYTLDQAASTTPDTTSEGTATAKTYTDVGDGPWWFHVRARNGAGLWGPAAHHKIQIDTAAPAAPGVSSSSHPDPGTYYANSSFTASWSAPVDVSGIAGYGVVVDTQPATNPTTVTQTATTYSTSRGDGTWYLHVRAKDAAGNWGATAHLPFRVSVSKPTPPPWVESASHPSEAPSIDTTVDITWGAGSSPSGAGIAGYSWVWNKSPDFPADAYVDSPATERTVESPHLPTGEWFFHLRTVDSMGRASDDVIYGPFNITDPTPEDLPVPTVSNLDPTPEASADCPPRPTVTEESGEICMSGHVRQDKGTRTSSGVLWPGRTRGWIGDQALYWGAPCVSKVHKTFKRECTAQSHAIRKLNQLTGGGADGQKYGHNRYVDWELGPNKTNGSCGDESEHDTDYCEPPDADNFRTDLFVHGDTSHEIAEVRYWTKSSSQAVGRSVQDDRIARYKARFAEKGIVVEPSNLLRDVKTSKGTGWAVWYLSPCQCSTWYAWAPRAEDEDGTFSYHRSGSVLQVNGHIYFTKYERDAQGNLPSSHPVPDKVRARAVAGDREWQSLRPPTLTPKCSRSGRDRKTVCIVILEPR